MLELSGLTKRFGNRTALDGLSFSVTSGRLCGFLGANGAGKTTTMRAIFAMLPLDAGRIIWRGAPVDLATRRRFGYLPEQRGLYPRMRLADQLVYHGRLHGMAAAAARRSADALLDELGLTERAGDKLEVLSHGNQQRVQLAAALVHDPELLVLDEPFSGLDPLGVAAMEALLRRRAAAGAAVMFSSHQLDLVEDLCDDVVLIHAGRLVVQGPLNQVRDAHPRRVVEAVYAGGRRVITQVGAGAAIPELAREAAANGPLAGFTFRSPSLAEIFREEVGGPSAHGSAGADLDPSSR